MILYCISKTLPPPVSNFFISFSSIIDMKIGYIKLGGGLFNSSYKTIYLSKKSKHANDWNAEECREQKYAA